ncbi:uncharacterized protein E0L32_004697 [Thyridium curvatum]|uniref:Uncharacterized protein n=1 Tax=Thyridium curvatum TaxID=1093900 RepID=A0A507BCL1_9PEZI|nr:uncharacterized protein E0L32_004697 [Thyridium curvatum]TPX15139.1 hypothetical protein E0L32_004697 [Thyridium curvatum]
MASLSPESRRGMQRRESSRSSSKRRPRLLRAAATEPSITTSNASRGAMASPQSARRATDLLNQMAYVSTSTPESPFRGSSPPSAQSPIYERANVLGSSPTSRSETMDDLRPHPYSGRYYSFPSFDTWDPDQQEKEGDDIKVA